MRFPCKYEHMSFHNEFTVYESCIVDFVPHCRVCSLNMVEKLHKKTSIHPYQPSDELLNKWFTPPLVHDAFTLISCMHGSSLASMKGNSELADLSIAYIARPCHPYMDSLPTLWLFTPPIHLLLWAGGSPHHCRKTLNLLTFLHTLDTLTLSHALINNRLY